MNVGLADELARMAEEDQRMRESFAQDGPAVIVPPIAQMMEMSRIDVANTDRLREIVDEHGWPGRSLVGDEGAENAWLLAQHADQQLDFQRRALELLTAAVSEGEAAPKHLAYLTDRVRVAEGREQVYGTQLFPGEHGRIASYPLEDPDRVDERRAEVGLEPLAEYVREAEGRTGEPTER